MNGSAPQTDTRGERLYWTRTSAISVMSSPSTPDAPLQPYYNQASDTWHPIAQSPMTEPKVSPITVKTDELGQWDAAWNDVHWGHTEPANEEIENAIVEWAIDSDDSDEDSDEEGKRMPNYKLVKCCGTLRPCKREFKVTVTPTVAGAEGFVTIHDFLTVLHPWLMRGLRSEILNAKELTNGGPLGPGTELIVDSIDPCDLMIMTKDELTTPATAARCFL